ncbi:hypothetical protein [Streptomyces avicenniae]|uniref:DUF7848 domain-containing protein n=1 Tax=Streptomyces avicenniae TaxID=500153 RepID=UPI00069BC9AF|nr:hypothetical protein [Streptomyces avicenniae]
MTARGRVFRFREWRVQPESGPFGFSMECVVCDQYGPEEESSESALGWVFAHLRANPEHHAYRERITRPYRAVPGGWL